MVPFKNRLKREDFSILPSFKKKVFYSLNFTVKIYCSEFKPSRFAVVASSSFFKKAAERNRIKRCVKGIIVDNLNKFKEGLAVIVYPKKNCFKEELLDLFKKAGIFK